MVKTARAGSSTSTSGATKVGGSVGGVGAKATSGVGGVVDGIDQSISGGEGQSPDDNATGPEGSLTSTVEVPGVGLVGVVALLGAVGLFVRRRLP